MTDRGARRGTTRAGRIAGAAVLAALLALAGWWTGSRAAGAEADRARSAAEQAVERQALETWRVEGGGGGPEGLLVLSQRVVGIERRPGTCETKVPGAFADPAFYDYHAILRRYSWFGVPMREVRFSCGGLVWRTR